MGDSRTGDKLPTVHVRPLAPCDKLYTHGGLLKQASSIRVYTGRSAEIDHRPQPLQAAAVVPRHVGTCDESGSRHGDGIAAVCDKRSADITKGQLQLTGDAEQHAELVRLTQLSTSS